MTELTISRYKSTLHMDGWNDVEAITAPHISAHKNIQRQRCKSGRCRTRKQDGTDECSRLGTVLEIRVTQRIKKKLSGLLQQQLLLLLLQLSSRSSPFRRELCSHYYGFLYGLGRGPSHTEQFILLFKQDVKTFVTWATLELLACLNLTDDTCWRYH